MLKRCLHAALALGMLCAPAMAAERPLVVELFTSQGCSSCPMADELLLGLAEDPALLPLSLHVHYWDRLGWKDTFSSEDNTARQLAYKELHHGHTYTPQMIVDGAASAVGNNEPQVKQAIAYARQNATNVPVTLKVNAKAGTLDVGIAAAEASTGSFIPSRATVYAMQFRPRAVTEVKAGENRGRTIETANNVVRITPLGEWARKETHYQLPLEDIGGDGIAIIVQSDAYGRIVGAARYLPGAKS